MPKLRGSILVTKRLLEHPVWEREAFSYGQAWLDLLLRANDMARSVTINGELIPLERGQLAWSLRTLEEKWKRSGEWISRFLRFCQNEGMILVDSNRRRTIITVVNYDTYNTTDFATVTESKQVTEAGTVTESKPVQKGERGRGNENREEELGRMPAPGTGFAEVPSEAEVLAAATAYPGDISRAIPPGIPEGWALGWFEWHTRTGQWPKKWRENFTLRFTKDWVEGRKDARGAIAQNKKNGGAVQTGGRSAAQARFELSRELEGIQERLDAHHENSTRPRLADVAREKELKKLIKELPE